MTIIYALDLAGTLVFAISGVLTAVDRKFDLVGSLIIGAVTAIGGGTIRDILIGETPVGWMHNAHYLYIILIALTISYFFGKQIVDLRKSWFLFDTVGIGIFTILGMQKTLDTGLPLHIAIIMGIISAVFGGVLRDVLCNEVPLIFRKEIYATACLIGALIYAGLQAINPGLPISIPISVGVVILIRYFSVKNEWSLAFEPK
ncbi:UNVERIFIED_CONTAM: hypothetical protein GTU68_027503 [Idotea baltica]|nr:hypothetical protein [Idotea baltica]